VSGKFAVRTSAAANTAAKDAPTNEIIRNLFNGKSLTNPALEV
jgi:hypothetical protein